MVGKTDFDTSPPTSARVSARIWILTATIFQWAIASVDISQALLQSETMAPDQRVRVIPPFVTPCPRYGRADPLRARNSRSQWCFLTLRPLYGTTCAPLRWFSRIAPTLVRRKWFQTKTDPCVFRLEINAQRQDVCINHVGDILITGSQKGHAAFKEAIDSFHHIGIVEITEDSPFAYLGIEISKRQHSYRIHQVEYAMTRLHTVLIDDVVRNNVCFLSV